MAAAPADHIEQSILVSSSFITSKNATGNCSSGSVGDFARNSLCHPRCTFSDRWDYIHDKCFKLHG